MTGGGLHGKIQLGLPKSPAKVSFHSAERQRDFFAPLGIGGAKVSLSLPLPDYPSRDFGGVFSAAKVSATKSPLVF